MTDAGYIADRDEQRIRVPLDFLGINYYYRTIVRAGQADEPTPFVGNPDIEPCNADYHRPRWAANRPASSPTSAG